MIPTTVGAFLGPKNYADADMTLKLWWRCNYINYGSKVFPGKIFCLKKYNRHDCVVVHIIMLQSEAKVMHTVLLHCLQVSNLTIVMVLQKCTLPV